MKIQIKTIAGSVLFEGDFTSVSKCVEAAVAAGANLTGAYLTGANLTGAYLTGANLTGANLTGANLAGAYLAGANLTGAYLTGAYLTGAYLTGAYLTGAYLAGAYLAGAYLAGANLTGANLAGANLAGAKNTELTIAKTRILPAGTIIGWKKLRDDIIAQLEIPADATRSHAFGRKCRASKAKVLAMFSGAVPFDGIGHSIHAPDFLYHTGSVVEPTSAFDDNWQDECAAGIHFYITREEAEAHS